MWYFLGRTDNDVKPSRVIDFPTAIRTDQPLNKSHKRSRYNKRQNAAKDIELCVSIEDDN